MISTTFKDRFEEFANVCDEYTGDWTMSKDKWEEALSEIDKQVAEERKEIVRTLKEIIPWDEINNTSITQILQLLERYYTEPLISKYSEEK